MLSEVEQQPFEYLFGILDKTDNGSLDKADFIKAFEGIKAKADAQRTNKIDNAARRWFFLLCSEGDENHDKKITKEEWLKWAATLPTQLPENGAYPRSNNRFTDVVFDSMSYNDETLTAAEYAAWFTSFGLKGDAAACFAQMDAGTDGKISFKDFYQLMREFVSGDATAKGYHLFGNIKG